MEYYLENEFLSLTFNSVGGTLTSIKNPLGIEYLWQGDSRYWSGQAPVLFPICGSLRNDQAITKDGKVLKMPRHGLVRKLDFQYVGQEWNRIVFSIMTNAELFKAFPYHFKLLIEYKLTGKTIQVNYIIENFGNEDMPFFIGGHPGFNCPLQEDETYNDYYIEFEKEENCSVPLPITETGLIDTQQRTPLLHQQKILPLTHALFEKDAIIFDEIQSRQVTLASHKSSHKVTVQYHDFPYLILWSSPNHGPFIAIEPWLGLSTCLNESDIFEEKRNVQIVKALRTNTYSYSIQID
ncbi:aldose 1-epimerase family protein [Candidatus Stoquefichus sp. SB1]|uniref:aldose 1-epimerase family protein n=1 Tax=Candidatus Stoquefichus sp. SB1 TaxID=1658109 RepID=UPI00067F128B|nr:aldose 1-epimerase family protein [Candidatus Stoquefichus sp. SB1]